MKKFTSLKMSHSLDEVVFENRNKQYGAYLLRQEADTILARSLFVGVSLFSVGAFLPILISSFVGKSAAESSQVEDPVWVLMEPLPPKAPDAKEALPLQEVAPIVTPKQILPSVPIPVRTPAITKEITPVSTSPMVSEVETSESGSMGGEVAHVPIQGPVGTGTSPEPAAKELDPNTIYGSVDVAADFGSGIEAFRSQVLRRFDSTGFLQESEVLKTTVSFVVEKDGRLSSIKASGPNAQFNKEAERTIASIKGKWKPAKVDGNFVRSSFRFPISMRFE